MEENSNSIIRPGEWCLDNQDNIVYYEADIDYLIEHPDAQYAYCFTAFTLTGRHLMYSGVYYDGPLRIGEETPGYGRIPVLKLQAVQGMSANAVLRSCKETINTWQKEHGRKSCVRILAP